VLSNPVVGRVSSVADRDHAQVRSAWRRDRARAVGDNEHIELEASCYTVDLLPHRARISININVGQLSARSRLNSRLFIRMSRDATAHHSSNRSRSFDHRLRARALLTAIRQRLPLPDQHHQVLARHACVDQVPLQHRVVLYHQRNDRGRVFRALGLMDRHRRLSKRSRAERRDRGG